MEENRLLKQLNQDLTDRLCKLEQNRLKLKTVVVKEKTEEQKQRIKKYNQLQRRHIFQLLSKRYINQGILLTPIDLWSMAKKQRGLCGLTGKRLKGNIISLDHVIPKSRGGSNDKSNLRLTIYNANVAKSNSTDEEFLELCKSVVEKDGLRRH